MRFEATDAVGEPLNWLGKGFENAYFIRFAQVHSFSVISEWIFQDGNQYLADLKVEYMVP